MTDIHDKVRRRAFEIWEAEGRPEGRDVEHWLRAEAECAAVPAKAVAAEPAKAARTAKSGAAAKPAAAKATRRAKAPDKAKS